MKKLLLFVLFTVASLQSNGQKLLVEPYVLGLIDDYQGRTVSKESPKEETLIDKFHFTEGVLVTFIDSLIRDANKRTYDKVHLSMQTWEMPNCYFCAEFKRMHSQRLAEVINDSYTYKWTKPTKKDEEKRLVGYLKPNLFKTPKEKMSFLVGAYVRYGQKDGGVYKYRLNNSASKFDTILRELKALRCDIKDVQTATEAPFIQQISFVPSEELKPYLRRQEKLREAILAKKEAFAKDKKEGKYALDLFSKE